MPSRPSPEAREDWDLLAAQREWLRTAAAGAFVPWPHSADERRAQREL